MNISAMPPGRKEGHRGGWAAVHPEIVHQKSSARTTKLLQPQAEAAPNLATVHAGNSII
jgi:hypothetical protein